MKNDTIMWQSKENTTSKNGMNVEPKWYKNNTYKLLCCIVLLAIVFFLFAILLNKWLNFGLSDDSVVITFIGILATFVVVSNYMQVKDIQSEFEKKTNDLQRDFDKKIADIQNIQKDFYNKSQEFELKISNQGKRMCFAVHRVFADLARVCFQNRYCGFGVYLSTMSIYYGFQLDSKVSQKVLIDLTNKIINDTPEITMNKGDKELSMMFLKILKTANFHEISDLMDKVANIEVENDIP